jgi:ADP-heptose:LPS heptosyltransferase
MKMLIISLSGIGNTIMYTPALRALRKKFPRSQIDFLVRKKTFGEVLENNDEVDNILVFENGGMLKKIFNLFKLFKTRYDVSIINFPSRSYLINLFSFFVFAKTRLGHSYNGFNLSFLQNKRIKANPNIHDIEQDLELLKLIGITYSKEDCMPSIKCQSHYGDEFFAKNKLRNNDFIIGIHAGSSTDNNFKFKRWGIEKFGELCNKLIDKHNAKIIFFGGPDEIELKRKLNGLINEKGFIINTDVKGGVSVVRKCRLFITNDSGPMHFAAASGVRTVALFCPTSHIRTRPYGDRNIVIRKNYCDHGFGYPFKSTSSKLIDNDCLEKISSEEVYNRIKKYLPNI